MDILFTCAGRRNYLLKYFREELNGHGRIFAADMSDTAPALYEADVRLKVPAVDDKQYIPTLLKICNENRINLLVSLNDVELPLLTVHRDKFESEGTELLLSSTEVVEICFDKLKTGEFLSGIGIPYPQTYIIMEEAETSIKQGKLEFPLFVKPRWGSASLQLFRVDTVRELNLAFELAQLQLQKTFLKVDDGLVAESILIQEGLPGCEYGLDILNDLNGRVQSVYVKKKLGMRAGETDKSELVDLPTLTELGEKIGRELGHIGNLDCDVFYDGKTAVVLEMNPRFGGGYPFSHSSGANFPNEILSWYNESAVQKKEAYKRFGQIVCKHDSIVQLG